MPDDPTPTPTPIPTPTAPEPTTPRPLPVGAEAPSAPEIPDTGYTESGVPTFDGVREKIESRYGTAIGSTELAEETTGGRTAAQQFDARQKAAEEKLAEIRASMHKSD